MFYVLGILFFLTYSFNSFAPGPNDTIHNNLNEIPPVPERHLKELEKKQKDVWKDFSNDRGFDRLETPKKSDWLYHVMEDGQTVDEYKAKLKELEQQRDDAIFPYSGYEEDLFEKIELIHSPGQNKDSDYRLQKIIKSIREYIEIYFGIETTIFRRKIPREFFPKIGFNEKGLYDTGTLLDFLYTARFNSNYPLSIVHMVLMTDLNLYSSRGRIYCSGSAGTFGSQGIGVSSLNYALDRSYNIQGALDESLLIIAHEIGHALGMNHCIYYKCLMNG